jgi:hypothetical protein
MKRVEDRGGTATATKVNKIFTGYILFCCFLWLFFRRGLKCINLFVQHKCEILDVVTIVVDPE